MNISKINFLHFLTNQKLLKNPLISENIIDTLVNVKEAWNIKEIIWKVRRLCSTPFTQCLFLYCRCCTHAIGRIICDLYEQKGSQNLKISSCTMGIIGCTQITKTQNGQDCAASPETFARWSRYVLGWFLLIAANCRAFLRLLRPYFCFFRFEAKNDWKSGF